MPTEPAESASPAPRERKPVLDLPDRLSEVIFGLIMALTFTGSISVAEDGHAEIRTLLIGAIGCNAAWGLVDAVMYVLNTLLERRRGLALLRALRTERDPGRARDLVAGELPPLVARSLRPEHLDHVRAELVALPEQPLPVLSGRDFGAAALVFLLVFLSTFPLVVPFLLPIEPWRALRLSNGVAIAMLFIAGWRLGKHASHRPALTGVSFVLIGSALVAVTMALGG
jgi:hypothetical protein